MLAVFLVFRNKEVLCPSNIVFGSYFLYFVFPCVLFYVLEWVDWVYVLPWGKTNDWSTLSDEAVLSYAYVFTLFYGFTRLFEVLLVRSSAVSLFEQYRVNPLVLFVFSGMILLGGLYFFQVTGGAEAWFSNYSDTYLENKKGYGLLNFLLIMSSNFLAFVLGFYWKTQRRISYTLLAFVLVALVFCAYIQGVKSRIFYFAIFFSIPWLTTLRLTLFKGAVLFVGFVLAFSFAMYFRSNGFYSTPEMLLEYFLSYFNTIFLHDMILRDMPPNFLLTMGYPLNKWLTFFGVPSEDYMHDISRWLTSIYFPKQWFGGAATQQWPVETELYLNYGNYLFWVVPIFVYSLFICALYSLRYRLGPVFLFIFTCELLFFLSMFRGSMLQWIALFNVIFYLMLWGGSRLLFVKEKVHVQ
ncbi:hypothetical protein [Pseudomonas sp. SDI]|uniref:hypothetical protein n=1 Tax=Pseudomonas sp. SDI TaxID=2170734 RepID=UPI001057B67B|nr:hypothetical protein [Pseudomonas sp. SDI]